MTRLHYHALDRLLTWGILPDNALRAGSRISTRRRQRLEERGGVEEQERRMTAMIARMSTGPIAESVEIANKQHYELPAEFFDLFLGPRHKYSCCLWEPGVDSLSAAEEAMLSLTCNRAGIRDGQTILDLGCGWGALSIWIAERFDVSVISVSNSDTQRRWIDARSRERTLRGNLAVVTADVNKFEPSVRFDRVLSIEMFEHMRNWDELLRRISIWLKSDGHAFIQTFSHRRLVYRFEGTWASERFFTEGLMPSHDLLLRFDTDLVTEQRWAISGTHYARTLAAWLARLDENSDDALKILQQLDGPNINARKTLALWRMFLIATEQIWGWRRGDEWIVSHYLLSQRRGHRTKELVADT
jgi:cyclopropane-fatty-acyl-phospholipid synthase